MYWLSTDRGEGQKELERFRNENYLRTSIPRAQKRKPTVRKCKTGDVHKFGEKVGDKFSRPISAWSSGRAIDALLLLYQLPMF